MLLINLLPGRIFLNSSYDRVTRERVLTLSIVNKNYGNDRTGTTVLSLYHGVGTYLLKEYRYLVGMVLLPGSSKWYQHQLR